MHPKSRVLLHTIAVEPARWTPERVSIRPAELAASIFAAGFRDIEVFEPHWDGGDAFALQGLRTVVLSSYIALTPSASPEGAFKSAMARLVSIAGTFEKIRIFPGMGMQPGDPDTSELIRRIQRIASSLPQKQILLETHDGSIADDPASVVDLVRRVERENVAILWQPTIFEPEQALRQFELQRSLVRHFHLQNRNPDRSFCRIRDGVIPWEDIFRSHAADISIEFVESGIRPREAFDLGTAIAEAAEVRDWLESFLS